MTVDVEIPETMQVETEHQEPETQQHQPSQRELTMRAIAERAEERRQEEIAQGIIYDEQARDAGLTFESHQEAEAAEEETQAEPEAVPEPVQEAPASPVLRTVTFEGRTFDVTEEQFAQLAQMGMLANVALHQYAQPPAQPQQQPVQQAPVVDPDLVRETVRRIQYGGEEDGGEALTRLITDVASRAQQPVDTASIVQQAAAMAQAQARLASETAIIQQEYKEIFDNPQLTLLAKLNVDALRARNLATGNVQNDIDVYREAGNAVFDALGRPRPNSDVKAALQAAPQVRQDVIERKRAAPRATTQVDRRAPSPQMPRPPSGTEIVERMRKQRGQSSMM